LLKDSKQDEVDVAKPCTMQDDMALSARQ